MLAQIIETFAITAPYFAVILCGYAGRRFGVMGVGAARALNDFVLFFALPALLIRTIAGFPPDQLFNKEFMLLWSGVGLAMFAATLLAALLLFKERPALAVIEAASATHGNVGYLGLTLVVGVLGAEATALTAMSIILDLTLIIPLTIGLLAAFGAGAGAERARLFSALRSAFVNPFIAAIGLGVLLSVFAVKPAGVVDQVLTTLGDAAIPVALFAIGVSLSGLSLGRDWRRMAGLSLAKLAIHPLAVLAVGALWLDFAPEVVAAAALLAALPTANNVYVVAMRSDARPELVSSAILVSTLASVASFNLFAAWLAP